MNAEYPPIHHRSQRQVVEDLTTVPPYIDTPVLPYALVVEPIHLRNLPRLVVASYQRDPVRIPHFQCQQQQESLYGVKTSIDKVSHEKVIRLGTHATVFEQLHEVEKLTVDVTADRNGRIDVLDVAFFNEDFSCFETELFDLCFGERLTFLELLNLQIEIARHDGLCLGGGSRKGRQRLAENDALRSPPHYPRCVELAVDLVAARKGNVPRCPCDAAAAAAADADVKLFR